MNNRFSQPANHSATLVALLWCLLTVFSCGAMAKLAVAEGDGMRHASHAMNPVHDHAMPCCEQPVDCCQPLLAVSAKGQLDQPEPLALPVAQPPAIASLRIGIGKDAVPDHRHWLMTSYPRLHLVHSVLLD